MFSVFPPSNITLNQVRCTHFDLCALLCGGRFFDSIQVAFIPNESKKRCEYRNSDPFNWISFPTNWLDLRDEKLVSSNNQNVFKLIRI